LDWVLVWNRRHLEQILACYLRHYNTARPHRGIDLDLPVPPPRTNEDDTEPARPIERIDILSGLIHEYRRAA
jgi:putative transposase